MESVLIVLEGECEFRLPDETVIMNAGDALTVPPEVIHQIKAIKDLKAAHIMPNDIKFEYFK